MAINKQLIANIILLTAVALLLAILVFFPADFFVKKTGLNTVESILVFLGQIMVFFFFLCLPLVLKNNFISRFFFALIFSAYYFSIYFLMAYWQVANSNFDAFYFIDSYKDLLSTGRNILNPSLLIMLLLTFALFYLFFYFISYLFFKHYTYYAKNNFFKSSYKYGWAIIIFIVIFISLPTNQSYLKPQLKQLYKIYQARKYFPAFQPDNSHLKTNSNQSIFILQLESGNSMVLEKFSPTGEAEYFLPNLYQIAKAGVIFPYFWSNSVNTDRAQANILCGINGNIDTAFSYRLEELTTVCLPDLLEKSGYQTIAFRSDDLWFHNRGNYIYRLGFNELHHDDIMQPGDKKYNWGYDDCIFYQRAFEYLTKNYAPTEKLLVYIEVSSSHSPFYPKEDYADTHKIENPENIIEFYLNSMSEQDYCVEKFYQAYQKYTNGDAHLFILFDNSIPLGAEPNTFLWLQEAYNENFLTILSYIPPRSRKNEFYANKIAGREKIYSQTDFLPTLFELLNNKNYPNSFAFELIKGKERGDYEDCQLLSQPYNPARYAVIYNNKNKYIYSLAEKELTYFDLEKDFEESNPEIVATDLSYQEFKEKYFCPRYR